MTETIAPAAPDESRFGEPPPPAPHPLKTRRFWLRIAPLLIVLNIPFLHYALRGAARTTTTIPFGDQFERDELGDAWTATGGFWRIVDGWLYSPGVKNNPLWLRAALPHDVRIELDAKTTGTQGDIKVELFGNGRDHSSGYVCILGGWNNTISIISRLDEHGSDRMERRDRKVEKNRVYHFIFERKGATLTWLVDGEKFLEWNDKAPLEGSGHDRMAVGTWTSDVYFDNVSVTPL